MYLLRLIHFWATSGHKLTYFSWTAGERYSPPILILVLIGDLEPKDVRIKYAALWNIKRSFNA
jgi:hypothetical protein